MTSSFDEQLKETKQHRGSKKKKKGSCLQIVAREAYYFEELPSHARI